MNKTKKTVEELLVDYDTQRMISFQKQYKEIYSDINGLVAITEDYIHLTESAFLRRFGVFKMEDFGNTRVEYIAVQDGVTFIALGRRVGCK